jgi:hypothetical protein
VCGLAGRASALLLSPAYLGVAGDASTTARFGHAKQEPLNLGVYDCFQPEDVLALQRKPTFTKTPDWGMFKLVPERKNIEITGSLRYLQSAGFVGFFIPVQTQMNFSEIEPAKDFPAQFAPSLSRRFCGIHYVRRRKQHP